MGRFLSIIPATANDDRDYVATRVDPPSAANQGNKL
jgi:hypothetical protein